MTFKNAPSECFVYITLPEETAAVTAGKFELANTPRGNAYGRFVYGRSYLENQNAVEIDPVELKLSTKIYETAKLNGVFGALRDASPDSWGRRVIEKQLGKVLLSEMDYLLESPDDRAGALSFGLHRAPPAPRRAFNRTIDLEKLQVLADRLAHDELSTDPDALQIQDLLLLETSMGGARPKAVIEHNDGLWIAKFNRPNDRWNHARVEHAMLQLARNCGMNSAESRIHTLAGRDILLVKRFDREKTPQGYRRARMVSALTVLLADDSVTNRVRWSYLLLVEELRRFIADPKDSARELFRRICFNALISNLDDHPRNHAVIAPGRQWTLSPAFDLMPSPAISQEHRDLAMDCGDHGRYANAKNLLSQYARFMMERNEAEQIIQDMHRQVAHTWENALRTNGVPDNEIEILRSAFVYPGFLL